MPSVFKEFDDIEPRSPFSILLTKTCLLPKASASWTCVTPDAFHPL
jgi:hypothetical protein